MFSTVSIIQREDCATSPDEEKKKNAIPEKRKFKWKKKKDLGKHMITFLKAGLLS